MSWKILGIIDGRNGHVTILPEWAVGTPNNFEARATAEVVRDALTAAATPSVQGAPKSPVAYVVVPAIDEHLHAQLKRIANPEPIPKAPAVSIGGALLGS